MNPLILILEKADLQGFQEKIQETGVQALDIRLDGINVFTAIITCNAPVHKKLELFAAAKKRYLKENDSIQQYVDEEFEATTPDIKEPIICQAIPFICRYLTLLDIETLLMGLKQEGVIISEEDKKVIKEHALAHRTFVTSHN